MKTSLSSPLFVFDQAQRDWFAWDGDHSRWLPRRGADQPAIQHHHFTGTGTRTLDDSGRRAIIELFERSF